MWDHSQKTTGRKYVQINFPLDMNIKEEVGRLRDLISNESDNRYYKAPQYEVVYQAVQEAITSRESQADAK